MTSLSSKWKYPSRMIITDKGMQLSNELRNESTEEQRMSRNIVDDQLPIHKRFAAVSVSSYPSGFHSQLQSQMSVTLMKKPFRQPIGFIRNASSVLGNNPSVVSQNDPAGLERVLFGLNEIEDRNHNPSSALKVSASNPALRTITTMTTGSGFGRYSTGKDFHQTCSSTMRVVADRQALEQRISVNSLGGLKVNLKNINYQSEMEAQNALQKEQINSVQRERLAKKYNDWNDQYTRHNHLMRSKYYERQEDIGKLGDKEDEDLFWKQWHSLKDSCDQAIDLAQKQNARYEERVISKLNHKYKAAFKNLPACAKQPIPRRAPLHTNPV